MALDEAIEERLKVIKVQEKLYEEASTNESKEIIKSATDNDRQLVEWLTELKDLREKQEQLKRILKNAMSDIYKKCSCNNFDCDICEKESCDYDDRFTWRLEEKAFDLIYKRGDAE
ncbi:MAG: hypothetical protein II249_03400 [Bacteroidaceae bacterium]|nr:hypothetical protein [Bacteroidaceae bacterium]